MARSDGGKPCDVCGEAIRVGSAWHGHEATRVCHDCVADGRFLGALMSDCAVSDRDLEAMIEAAADHARRAFAGIPWR